MLALALIVLGALSRLIVHVPNFTPVIAIALFAGVYLKKNQAVIFSILILAMTDIILGYHPTILFTWGTIGLIAALGIVLRKKKSFPKTLGFSLLSAFLFYLITNFGVWLTTGIYAKTLTGLVECYVMAIPFFRSTLVSTLGYTFVLFGAYEILASQIKKTRFAHALLS